MRNWNELGTAAIIGLLIIGIAGCVEEKNDKISAPELTSEYKVECSPISGKRVGTAYLKVRVEGKAADLRVNLSNPEGFETGFACISREELIDGSETVKVCMEARGEMLKAGTYTLVIFRTDMPTRDVVYTEYLKFSAAKVRVIGRVFVVEFDAFTETYRIITLKLSVINEGELPAYIGGGKMVIDDEEYALLFCKGISPKESELIVSGVHTYEIKSGTYPVTITLHTQQVELARYETQLTLGD